MQDEVSVYIGSVTNDRLSLTLLVSAGYCHYYFIKVQVQLRLQLKRTEEEEETEKEFIKVPLRFEVLVTSFSYPLNFSPFV